MTSCEWVGMFIHKEATMMVYGGVPCKECSGSGLAGWCEPCGGTGNKRCLMGDCRRPATLAADGVDEFCEACNEDAEKEMRRLLKIEAHEHPAFVDDADSRAFVDSVFAAIGARK